MTKTPAIGQFGSLVQRIDELKYSEVGLDIEKDLLRTFPSRMYTPLNEFSNISMEEQIKINSDGKGGIASLRKVLFAYALRNPELGYCQSMNYICALLLFHLSEEESFWVFAAIIEDIIPYGYYSPTMIGARVDNQVFNSIISWKLPKINQYIRDTNTILEPVSCPWFLCLFINTLPIFSVCRIWDIMFHEGNIAIIRFALSMMKSKNLKLKQADDAISIYTILKEGFFCEEKLYHSYILEEAKGNFNFFINILL